jgi:hypothetical protein
LFTTTLVFLGLLVNNATFTMFRRSQEHHYPDAHRQASGSYMYPTQQTAAHGQFAATPGHTYGHQQHLGWQGGYNYPQQQNIEYVRSPSKEHRARS